ncbi:MAG TPA: hypothetical protein VIK89_12390 [Cytophagaceae bacterium]
MHTRTTKGGKGTTIKADVFYSSNGKMVTHFTTPEELFIINNAKGELAIYNPGKNTVRMETNYAYGTEYSPLYYFFQDKKSDLGLGTLGFKLKETRFDKNLTITKWAAPLAMAKQLKEVELVHDAQKPIYQSYVDGKGRVLKKIYYYDYVKVENIDFPQSITQIEYFEKGDSSVTKTVYSDIRLNDNSPNTYFDFEVPSTAKLIK